MNFTNFQERLFYRTTQVAASEEDHYLSHSDMSIVRSTNHDRLISYNAFECFRRKLQPSEFRLAEC